MSHYDYHRSLQLAISDEPFAALIMAAMRRADTNNLETLRNAFPDIYAELAARIDAPNGVLPGETAWPQLDKED